MIEGFSYSRKSPDEKESTETSILNQNKLHKDFALKNNINLPDDRMFIDKSNSGSDRERPAFNRMIRQVITFRKTNPNKEIWILVKEQDRFARDSAFFTDMLTDLNAYRIKIFSILRNKFLSYDDLGDIVTSVVDASMIISSRKKAFMLLEQKRNEGMPPIPSPFGYKSLRKGKISLGWFVKEKEADIVRRVIESYLDKVSFKDIISNFKIDKSLYYRVIQNAKKGLYNGWIVYTKKIRDSKKEVVRTEEVKYLGKHPAIISEEQFKKLNPNFNPDGS